MTDSAEASNLEAPPSVADDSQLGFANDDEATQSSAMSSSNGESSRRSRNYNTRPLPVEVQHVEVHPSQIIEYEWPPKSGKKYFVQEQLSKVLGVTSFKRKFPDLTRRSMDGAERSYVVEDLKLSEVMPAHLLNGMTVLDGPEVHSLMATQYPEIYEEYTRSVAAKIKNDMYEKQRALDELATDKTKLAQLRNNALQNCAEFNKELNARRKGKAFYDHHTQLIMHPMNRFKKLKPEYTRPAPYPCALVPGQNSNFYKIMKPEELRKLPIKTVIENDTIFPPIRREKSPPSVIVTEQEARAKENEAKNKSAMTPSASSAATPAPEANNTPIRPSQSRRQSNPVKAFCVLCKCGNSRTSSAMIQCTKCKDHAHPDCINMTTAMTHEIKRYEWHCIECKICTICDKDDNEDKLMCCDKCDRGYHTFCVGLRDAPNGRWFCQQYCSNARR